MNKVLLYCLVLISLDYLGSQKSRKLRNWATWILKSVFQGTFLVTIFSTKLIQQPTVLWLWSTRVLSGNLGDFTGICLQRAGRKYDGICSGMNYFSCRNISRQVLLYCLWFSFLDVQEEYCGTLWCWQYFSSLLSLSLFRSSFFLHLLCLLIILLLTHARTHRGKTFRMFSW